MEEGKSALLKIFLQNALDGHFWQVIIAWLVLNIPSIVAWLSEFLSAKKLERIFESRVKDKDAEIKRLAARVKELENLTLKTKRP